MPLSLVWTNTTIQVEKAPYLEGGVGVKFNQLLHNLFFNIYYVSFRNLSDTHHTRMHAWVDQSGTP